MPSILVRVRGKVGDTTDMFGNLLVISWLCLLTNAEGWATCFDSKCHSGGGRVVGGEVSDVAYHTCCELCGDGWFCLLIDVEGQATCFDSKCLCKVWGEGVGRGGGRGERVGSGGWVGSGGKGWGVQGGGRCERVSCKRWVEGCSCLLVRLRAIPHALTVSALETGFGRVCVWEL